MSTMNLDSLNACLHQIATRTMRPHDPVLILNARKGYFKIQSGHIPLKYNETLIADNLDIDGIPGWTDWPDPTGIYVTSPWALMDFIRMVFNEKTPGAANTQGQGRMNTDRDANQGGIHHDY
ncbi:hypothetical protein [Desulfobacter postgatei]|uniref:Uncharacterized protein n=1 Tax=Desulfobacter postgatei 2ac9 TaxID=879212 RepID=I5B179_9BACT|nr:hypothetical protein [Desulfobacter postgatei]EIM63242.1 hypothetical protein DespoDRAFT_01282 [Desulfobacter postgatei 2ac9]